MFMSWAGNMSHPHAQNALTKQCHSTVFGCVKAAEIGKVFVAGSTGELGRRVLLPRAMFFFFELTGIVINHHQV